MQHADIEIPKAEPAVFSHTAESVVAVIAPPGVKCNTGNPGLMPLTPGHKSGIGYGPDGDEVVLTACQDVLGIWRPAHTCKPAVVGIK